MHIHFSCHIRYPFTNLYHSGLGPTAEDASSHEDIPTALGPISVWTGYAGIAVNPALEGRISRSVGAVLEVWFMGVGQSSSSMSTSELAGNWVNVARVGQGRMEGMTNYHIEPYRNTSDPIGLKWHHIGLKKHHIGLFRTIICHNYLFCSCI